MLRNSFITAAVLIVLALGFYLNTGEKTALSPLGPGVLILISALVAAKWPNAHKHAMHAAMAFALLGILAPLYPIVSDLAQGAFSKSAIESLIMLVVCAGYLALGVKSFIDARKAQSS